MTGSPKEETKTLNGRAAIRGALPELIGQSQRQLLLFADDLDPLIFSNDEFTAQLSKLARKTRRPDIRILLHRPSQLLTEQHRALPLIQRLSSLIEVRELHEQYANQRYCFMINDQPAMLYQPSCERYEAILTDNRNNLIENSMQFEQMWQQSHAAAILRRHML